MWIRWKRKRFYRMREISLFATYTVQVRPFGHNYQGLRMPFPYQQQFVLENLICIINFNKVMLLFESLFIFLYFLVSAKIWLAKRPSCPAISCSWAATRLASMVAFLISVAFCTNFSSFSFSSFSFFFYSFFLSSVSIAARQLRTSSSSSGDSCKND